MPMGLPYRGGVNRPQRSSDADPAERLRATLDSLLDPHVVMRAVRDDSGRIVDFEYTDANAAACAYNGLDYDDLMGRRLLELLPGHGSTGLFDRCREVIETGNPLILDDYVYAVEVLGGQERHSDIRGVALGDSIVYTWRDVTERHEQLQALAEAEREFRSLAEATTDLAYRTDSAGVIRWVSPSITRVLGWSPEEFVGRTIEDFSAPEELVHYREDRAQIYAGELAPDTHPERIFQLQGRDRMVPMVAFVSRDLDADGEWTGGLLVGLRDVSQVVAEQAIADRERDKAARLQLSMDRAAIGMAVTSVQGEFQYVNRALAKMLGYRQEDLVGLAFRDITHPDDVDASVALLQRLTADEVDHMGLRKRYLTLSGETIWVDVAVGVARTPDGVIDHFVAQIVDVTAEVVYAEALERTVRRFRHLAENASDVVYETDAEWRIQWISPSVQNVLGWQPEMLVGTSATDLIAPGQEDLLDVRQRQIHGGYAVGGDLLEYVTASGQRRWMSAMAHPVAESDGTISGAVVGLRDVTAEVEAREALSGVERRLRLAVDAAPDGLVITDEQGLLIDVNREFCRLIGREEQDLVGQSVAVILDETGAGPCAESPRHEHKLASPDGWSWIEHAVREVRGEEGSVGYHVHLFSDVTRDREVREELTHLATHDVLTGVANRRWFIERLQSVEESGARHRRRGERVGILFCDVDDLKALNDTYGHGVGDEALTAVADGLARGVRNSDDVGRMGGDEFVVILDGLTSLEDLRHVAEKLRSQVSQTLVADGEAVAVSASFGAVLVEPGEDPRAALQRADSALLRAKAQGRDRVVIDG